MNAVYTWQLVPKRTGSSFESRYTLVVRHGGKEIGADYLFWKWTAKRRARAIIRRYERSLKRKLIEGVEFR